MQFIALKELPKGTQPGDAFEANEDEGQVLILVGAARLAEATDPPVKTPTRRRAQTYQTRHLTAEE